MTYIQRNFQAGHSSIPVPLVHGVLDVVLGEDCHGDIFLSRTTCHGDTGIGFLGQMADKVAVQLSTPKDNDETLSAITFYLMPCIPAVLIVGVVTGNSQGVLVSIWESDFHRRNVGSGSPAGQSKLGNTY